MKIKNNLSLTISNLILKYVEEDIVLTLNVKQITSQPCADENWEIGITESNESDPVVRTKANIENLTICLDRRNPSTGQIDFYEKPILYRSGINVRILQRFSSHGQRIPDAVKISTQIDDFTLSLSERQLPMSIRLGELFGALYYGHLKTQREVSNSTPEADRHHYNAEQQGGDGWVSWAWNSVLGEEEEEMENNGEIAEKTPPLVSIGIHVKQCTVLLKCENEMVMRLSGIGAELTIKGEDFFSAVFGITHFEMLHLGRVIGRAGVDLVDKSGISYNYESLFDFRCSENNAVAGEYYETPHDHFQQWTEPYAHSKYGAFYLDYVFTMKSTPTVSTADLPKVEHWSTVKEKSWQRILIPPINLVLSAKLIHTIERLVRMSKHAYPVYFNRITPRPLSTRAEVDQLTQLSLYVPTRQVTVKSTSLEIIFENDFEPVALRLEEAEFVQNEIMYKVPFAHAVANYAELETVWPQLAKWCYVTRKLSATLIEAEIKGKQLAKVANILANGKVLILPDFWQQPNSPPLCDLSLYIGVNHIHLCINSSRAQILEHIKRTYFDSGPAKSVLLVVQRDEEVQVWADTFNVTLERERFMGAKVNICCLFLDRLKCQCTHLLTFSSVPGFVNVKAQLPDSSNVESNAQVILVGDIARFIGAIEPDFVDVAHQFATLFNSVGQAPTKPDKSPEMTRIKAKKVLTAIVNVSLAQSSVAMRNEEGEVCVDLPQARLYTSGMTNLTIDMDLPSFISNPIHSMAKCPTSLQINLSQVDAYTTIMNKKHGVLSLPATSIMISLNIPDSPLVPIMIIINLDLASCLVNLSRLQLYFLVKLCGAIGATRPCFERGDLLNESFCAKTFEKFEFSDVTSDKNDDEEKQIKNFMMTLSARVAQFNTNFYADHHRLKIGLMELALSLSDHLTHSQAKVNVPQFYVEVDGERLLTSDGRGQLPVIGRNRAHSSGQGINGQGGLDFIYTKAETKHWRQQENVTFEKDIKLSRFIEGSLVSF